MLRNSNSFNNSINSTNSTNSANSKKQFFIDTIAKFCDKCGSAYKPEDLNIVLENGLTTIIHFSCTNCKSSHIASFIMPLGLASRVPVNTDLSTPELMDFANQSKVSIDDILTLYETLKEESR